jgi:hypothetical protein
MTNTPSLAEEQHRLRLKAEQELRTARQARADVIYSLWATPQDREQANATWYATIRRAASDGVLTPGQIQTAAILSRQRYHQIVRNPKVSATPKPTEVQLPKEDV